MSQLVTMKELEKMYGVSYWFWFKNKAMIPHIRIGKKILFRVETVEKWLHDQEMSLTNISNIAKQDGKIRRID